MDDKITSKHNAQNRDNDMSKYHGFSSRIFKHSEKRGDKNDEEYKESIETYRIAQKVRTGFVKGTGRSK